MSHLSLLDLPAAPGVKVRVRAVVQPFGGLAPAPAKFSWDVLFNPDQPVKHSLLDASGSLMEFEIARTGQFIVLVNATLADGKTTCTMAVQRVTTRPFGMGRAYLRVRITPPPDAALPVQETQIQVKTGEPLSQPLLLQGGVEVTFDPISQVRERKLFSYVRISHSAGGVVFEGHTRQGPARALLVGPLAYDMLVVPDNEGEDVAPILLAARAPIALNAQPQRLDAGFGLTGTTTDADRQPVNDVSVVLRAGALTSTVGVSNPSGAYALRLREGTFSAVFSPPPGKGLPQAQVSATAAMAIAGSGTVLDFQWNKVAVSRLLVRVKSPLGAIGQGRVRIEDATDFLQVGVARLRPAAVGAAPVILSATGHLRTSAILDARGEAEFPVLPHGRYRLTVFPSDGVAAATTALTLDLSGNQIKDVTLGVRVPVQGRLLPERETAGVRLLALDQGGDFPRPVATAVVGSDGRYTLSLEPDRTYLIQADPRPGTAFGRQVLHRVKATTNELLPDRTLPAALLWKGRALTGSSPVGGAVLQLFCLATTPDCLDPTQPLAEGTTQPDGSFALILPDPGP